jgi:hypothetical protein
LINFKPNGSLLFEGVVEDRNDPLKLGRVRVRVFGKHTESLAEIPTDHLFWASVLMPVTSASTSGVGQTPGLVEGSHVVGYFRDGIHSQDPVIIGSILGIPINERKEGVGFNDPRKTVPASLGGKAFPRWTNEPDTSRYARNENVPARTIKTGISTSTGGTFNQPASPYAAQYPYNKVIETESGHVVEYDDTPGAERINISHRSGTFIEMHPDGTITIKSVKDTFDIVTANKNEYVGGNHNLTIDSSGNIYCKGDYTFKTDGNMKFDVAGDVEWNVQGDMTQQISGNLESTSSTVKLTGNSSTTIKGGGTTEQLNSNYTVSTGTFGVTASSTSFS